MSVRAYRVNEIIQEDQNSFNLYHDQKLMDFLDSKEGFSNNLSCDCTGLISVSVDTLEEALNKASELELDEDTIESLKKDIAWAKAHDDDYVQYYCY